MNPFEEILNVFYSFENIIELSKYTVVNSYLLIIQYIFIQNVKIFINVLRNVMIWKLFFSVQNQRGKLGLIYVPYKLSTS